MNEAEAAEFRALILDRLAQRDQEDALGQDAQATVTLDQQAVGRLSRQDALLSQSMARATQARRNALHTALQAALTRIGSDDYGWCEDCGEAIAPARLRLDPTARLCIACAAG